MKHSTALKMGLMGALISLGVFAADDSRTKDMNKGKADAAFVEEAAMAAQTDIKMSELAVTQSTNASVKELAQKNIDDHTKAFESLKEIATNKGIMLPFQSVGSTGTTGSSTGTGGTGASGTGSRDTTGSDKVGSVPKAPADTTTGMNEGAAAGEGHMGSGDPMPGTPKNVYGQLSTAAQKKYDELAKLSGEKFDKQFLSSCIDNNKKSIKVFEKESKSGTDSELKTFATNTLPTLKQHLDMAQSVERELKASKTPSM